MSGGRSVDKSISRTCYECTRTGRTITMWAPGNGEETGGTQIYTLRASLG